MDANYICLFCHGAYHTNRHHCTYECHINENRVYHFDLCLRCKNILGSSFTRQLAKPRIRVEDK